MNSIEGQPQYNSEIWEKLPYAHTAEELANEFHPQIEKFTPAIKSVLRDQQIAIILTSPSRDVSSTLNTAVRYLEGAGETAALVSACYMIVKKDALLARFCDSDLHYFLDSAAQSRINISESLLMYDRLRSIHYPTISPQPPSVVESHMHSIGLLTEFQHRVRKKKITPDLSMTFL